MMMMMMVVVVVMWCCGLFQVRLWQCFLSGATDRLRHQYVHAASVEVIGVDAAKLACCIHATSDTCRILCQQVQQLRRC